MGFLNGGLICLLNFNARIREFTIVSLELKEDNIPINLGIRLSGATKYQHFREVKSERLDRWAMHANMIRWGMLAFTYVRTPFICTR